MRGKNLQAKCSGVIEFALCFSRAGYLYQAGMFKEALNSCLKVGEKALDKAIDVVGAARSEALMHHLIDYLMGEHDKVPKDPNYIYRLYMAFGNFKQVRAGMPACLPEVFCCERAKFSLCDTILCPTTSV